MKAIYAIGLSITLVGAAQARPHHQPPTPPAQVLSRQGDRLLLSRDHGWRKEVLLDVNTNYDSNQPPAAGDFLEVRDELRSDGLYHAVAVRRFQGHPVHGKVLALNNNGFLLDNHGEPLQVDVSSTTRYKWGPFPGTRSVLSANRPAEVVGKQGAGGHVEATQVNVPFPWMQLALGAGLSAAAAGVVLSRRRQAIRPRIDD